MDYNVERVVEIIKSGKSYLQKNDLDGFFKSINGAYIGPCADFLYKNGVDIFKYLHNIPDGLFLKNDNIKIADLSNVTSIGKQAFYQSSIEEVIMGDSVEKIDEAAFAFCSKLQNVKLSENLTAIPVNCFYEDKSLTDLYLPDSVKRIALGAFSGCDNINITAHKRNGVKLKCAPDDVEFLKKHLHSIKEDTNESLVEAFSDKMPKWLKSKLLYDLHRYDDDDLDKYAAQGYNTKNQSSRTNLANKLKSRGIEISKAKFEEKDPASILKRKDPILSNENYLPAFHLVGHNSWRNSDIDFIYIKGVNDDESWPFDDNNYDKYLKYIPLKHLLDHCVDFCYIDITDSENLLGDKVTTRHELKRELKTSPNRRYTPAEQAEMNNYRNRYTFDKSGYLIKPDKFEKKLQELGKKNYQKKLDDLYNKLTSIKSEIARIYDEADVKGFTNNSSIRAVRDIRNYFDNACDYYGYACSYVERYIDTQREDLLDTVIDYIRTSNQYITKIENSIKKYMYADLDFESLNK